MHPHRVRKNLYTALRQLRDRHHRTYLWIDVLCIDQANEREKSSQIPLMPDIYRNVSSVVIWLGPPRDDRRAFEFIRNVLDPATLDMMTEKSPTAETALPLWIAFAKLLEHPIRPGKADWVDFSDAVTLFAMHCENVRRNMSTWKPSLEPPNAIKHPRSTGAWVLTRIADEAIHKPRPPRATSRDPEMGLETLVIKCRPFASSDIRDTIFALLGLASDFTPDVLRRKRPSETIISPQYNLDTCQAYVDFVKYCVKRTKSLDIICQHWAQVPLNALADTHADAPGHNLFPWWIGLNKDSAFGLPSWGATRTNGDSLGRGPDSTSQPYSGIIYAQGIILGRVNKCSDWAMEGTISYICWPILGWEHRQSTRNMWMADLGC
ncbi:heterokaryon incompatibility protein-domain-containing protein [Hypoxylon crocopeplum]|nr:heterokaryon incompatibility protein-domain-containing protein [Hypoxylon crocopeplum]